MTGHLGQLVCRDCGAEITGTDDGTGLPYCWDCDEGKDDEHVLVVDAQGIRQAMQDELAPRPEDEDFLRRSRDALKAAGADDIDLTGRGQSARS